MTKFIGENYLGGDAYSLSSDRNPMQSLRKQIGAEHLAGMFASHGKTPDYRNGDGVGGVAPELAGRGGPLDRAGRKARQI